MQKNKLSGIIDILESIKIWRVTLYLALSDIRARYKRSTLGPLWLTLGTAIGVAGLGWLWSSLLKISREEFIPPLTIGLITWQFISGCLTESPSNFLKQASIIRNLKLPYFLHIQQLLLRHLINFLHNIVIFVFVALLLDVPINSYTLLFIPCLLIFILNLTWIILFLSILGARFRDIEYAMGSIIPLLFFASPVIYRPNNLSTNLIWFNPITYLIEIIRLPLLGNMPSTKIWIVSLSMLALGWIITIYLFNRTRNKIVFWI